MPTNKIKHSGDEDVEGHGLNVRAAGFKGSRNDADEDVEGHGLKVRAAGFKGPKNDADEDDVEGHARRM